MRVLIVDDSSVMRKIITRGLRQANFTVDDIGEAGNGEEALEQLRLTRDVDLNLMRLEYADYGWLDVC